MTHDHRAKAIASGSPPRPQPIYRGSCAGPWWTVRGPGGILRVPHQERSNRASHRVGTGGAGSCP